MNWWQLHGQAVVSSLIFSVIGIFFFGLFFAILPKLLPFSMKKEIEEDQNVALAIIIAAIVIGMAVIIAATVG